jgi:hypothetical protein
MANWFNRVVEEVKEMEKFKEEFSMHHLEVSESERHPSFTIMNEDFSGAVATYRFDTETQQFYKEVSGRDDMHYGNENNFLTMRLYFQTVSQLKNNISDVFNDTPPTFLFMDKLTEALSDDKYKDIELDIKKELDGHSAVLLVKENEVIEEYHFNYFKNSNFEKFTFEVYTSNSPIEDVWEIGNGKPIETRSLYSLFGAVADAVKKVDMFLSK